MRPERTSRKAPHKVKPERIKAVKEAIIAHNGSVNETALALGWAPTTLSRFLNHCSMARWWKAFRRERTLARRRRYAKKKYASEKEKTALLLKREQALREQGIDVDDLVGHIK